MTLKGNYCFKWKKYSGPLRYLILCIAMHHHINFSRHSTGARKQTTIWHILQGQKWQCPDCMGWGKTKEEHKAGKYKQLWYSIDENNIFMAMTTAISQGSNSGMKRSNWSHATRMAQTSSQSPNSISLRDMREHRKSDLELHFKMHGIILWSKCTSPKWQGREKNKRSTGSS